MAHFAEINDENIVTRVIVVNNNELIGSNGEESELLGIEFCKSLYGNNTKWIQTSYNKNFRKNYAGINFKYDSNRDAFIPPKPFNSWLLNENTCLWESPIPYPNDDKKYIWNEETKTWDEFIPPS